MNDAVSNISHNEESIPEYRESFITTRMEYLGRIWQLEWNAEKLLMRLSIVRTAEGSNTEILNIIAYLHPGHKYYVEGRSLNDTLRTIVLEISDGAPPSDDNYISPWEKHFILKEGGSNV